MSDRFNNQIKHLFTKHTIPACLVKERVPPIREITKKRDQMTDNKWLYKQEMSSETYKQQSVRVLWRNVLNLQLLWNEDAKTASQSPRTRECCKRRSQSSAFADHYRKNYTFIQDPNIEISILRHNNDTLGLHIIEAMKYKLDNRK